MNIIKIHSLDNVAVALQDLPVDETVTVGDNRITLCQPIVHSHKFTLIPISEGEMIIKYGLPIGHAKSPIQPSEHIHSQNAKANFRDLDEYHYQYQPGFPALPTHMPDREVQLYRDRNGQVNIRNEL